MPQLAATSSKGKMELLEDTEPLVEFPEDLTDKDLGDKKPRDEAEAKRKAVFVDYDNLEKGVVSGTAYPPLFACF